MEYNKVGVNALNGLSSFLRSNSTTLWTITVGVNALNGLSSFLPTPRTLQTKQNGGVSTP